MVVVSARPQAVSDALPQALVSEGRDVFYRFDELMFAYQMIESMGTMRWQRFHQ